MKKIDLRWFGECSPKHRRYSLMFAEHSVTFADCLLRWSVIYGRYFCDALVNISEALSMHPRGISGNNRRCFADTSSRFADAFQIKKYRRMFGDCSANIPRLVVDHRRIFAEHVSRQNIANGSWKISKQHEALKILGIGEVLPHEYHEFRLFAEGSFIPPEHCLMLVNFHRKCIGDAKRTQWDPGISCEQLGLLSWPYPDFRLSCTIFPILCQLSSTVCKLCGQLLKSVWVKQSV